MIHQEWKYAYGPFNSWKALAWREELEAMSRGETPTPVCVTIDPTNRCNMNCGWCIMAELRQEHPVSLPDQIMKELPAFLAGWGVRSVCVGGGGEPFCHPKTADLLYSLDEHGLKVGTITNGFAVHDRAAEAVIETCRWIGFSVDAATNETYSKIKGASPGALDRVFANIYHIAEHRREEKRPQIGMKFCVHESNYTEIYEFVRKAKFIGADDVHFRPVYIPYYVFPEKVIDGMMKQVAEARKDFEDEKFKVYGIVHKFDEQWKRAIRFTKCRATPINGYFLADGTFALCCDRRNDPKLNLGPFYPFSKLMETWGSDEHKEMIAQINPEACPRCTQEVTNEIIEKVIINDEMCVEFP